MTTLAPAAQEALAPLTTTEQQALHAHEATIRAGIDTFVAVGNALAAIRNERLYRADYATFEDYARERWEIGRARAYQLMGAAQAALAVSTIVDIAPPANEAQARPLAGLAPDVQREVWQQATATAPGGKVSGAHVAEVAARVTGKPAPARPLPQLTPRPTPAPIAAGDEEIAAPPAPRVVPAPVVLTPLAPAAPPTADRKLLAAKRALLAAALELLDADLTLHADGPAIVIQHEQAVIAARMFLVNPALAGAAGMLAFSAREEAA